MNFLSLSSWSVFVVSSSFLGGVFGETRHLFAVGLPGRRLACLVFRSSRKKKKKKKKKEEEEEEEDADV